MTEKPMPNVEMLRKAAMFMRETEDSEAEKYHEEDMAFAELLERTADAEERAQKGEFDLALHTEMRVLLIKLCRHIVAGVLKEVGKNEAG